MNDNNPIRITSDEVERVTLPVAQPQPQGAGGPSARSYGTLASGPLGTAGSGAGSLWMRAWVYLGLAGLVGALVTWAACEPFTHEGRGGLDLALVVMVPLVVVMMCVAFGLAESWAERSVQKALRRSVLALAVGGVLSVAFMFAANLIFSLLLPPVGARSLPSVMLARAIGWAIFGAAGGVVYGLIGKSGKKCLYGVLGGVLGSGLGGLVFDPISEATSGGAFSRAVGFAILGASTGIAMGLVESALKDRWLYVSGGPLAGKQFILYKQRTVFGSQQSADIYLFKDPSILPTHVVVEVRGAQTVLVAVEPVFVNGQAVQEKTLKSGDQIQIGRYSFDYQEKRKQSVV